MKKYKDDVHAIICNRDIDLRKRGVNDKSI